jgi:scyllo-inositol 2-dehydrogenase (NADP+)
MEIKNQSQFTILIVGGGKMGMSHLAIATQYVGKKNVIVCDTKFTTRIIFRLLGYKVVADVGAIAPTMGLIGGVLIATPTPSHANLAKWAIGNGLPCFIEKPLTLNVNASNELKLLAAEKGVPVQVGFVLRYVATFQKIKHLVQSRCLGSVLDYTASMRGNVISKQPASGSWQGDYKMGGGCLNEYGPHIIDLCQFIFGQIDHVKGVGMTQVFCTKADDRIGFGCSHREGFAGKVEIDWCDSGKRKSVAEFKVKFEEAEVRVDNSAVEIYWNRNCRLDAEMRNRIEHPIRPKNVSFYLRGEEYSLEFEDFLGDCFRYRHNVNKSMQTTTGPGLADGCEVDRLIDEIAIKAGLK